MLLKEHEKDCLNCIYKTKLQLTGDLLCQFHGIVMSDSICKKFAYDIFTNHRKKKRFVDNNRYTADDFSL